MAVYKVPQDVEADDKLIGPFSFRQFIYLIVVAVAGFMAYILSQIFIGLVLIPLPIMIFFGAIALPLRKDQPMELYLLALVQFYLKPKKRKWEPEGTVVTVEITAPKVAEPQRTKSFSGSEASDRLSYLAQIMDTRGWAAKGVAATQQDDSTNTAPQPASTAKYEQIEEPDDILDAKTPIGQKFEKQIDKQETARKEELAEKIHEETKELKATKKSSKKAKIPANHKGINKESARKTAQKSNLKKTPEEQIEKASANTIPPDIINLANNTDFSLQTIAHEAKRINKREGREEVTIFIPHTKHR
ncbi:PrgI family protein [Candidatus Saccharibacteria bacterium]|nr:PrgI family protein [Candidatus Saccharibacteria bacterium]